MRLHYYTTAVPNSYCVGVHNGHGFGSLFAKLFSKVAAKTAAKAAAKVAAKVGRKAVKTLAPKVAEFAKKAGKEALTKGVEIGANLATEKINSVAEKAREKLGNHPGFVDSVSGVLKEGVNAAKVGASSAAAKGVDVLVDKSVRKAEQVAGIKRKQPSLKGEEKKHKVVTRDSKWNSIVKRMNQDE